MTIPAPNLDDRRFQDIVDEAKRSIASRCPEWTDHNVSDPGVALIELFAWMTELTLYRMNQVPDRLYVKFLELVGVGLYPPKPARTRVLFELAAPAADPVTVRRHTQVGTDRDRDPHQVVFMTTRDLTLVQPQLVACLTGTEAGAVDHTEALRRAGDTVPVFPAGLQPGDACYLGFAGPLSDNLIRLDVSVGSVEGAGIRPGDPPRTWESYTRSGWQQARVLSDTTKGFNASGEITLLLEPDHTETAVAGVVSHWLRCRLDPPTAARPAYLAPPRIASLGTVGLGGAVDAMHAEPVHHEVLGVSTGRPGQSFTVRRAPVLPRTPGEETVMVTPPRRDPGREPEPQPWQETESFAGKGPDARVFTWSSATGEIRFGPLVTYPDGTARQHGSVPPEDAQIAVTRYRYGGGRRGNVGPGTLTVLLSTIRSVGAVRNLDAATGGVDPETVANAKLRGPMELRGGNRAVTAADFERHTLAAIGGDARARCLPPATPADPVRVLVVPHVDEHHPETLTLAQLDLSAAAKESIGTALDRWRLLTTRVLVDVPEYQGVTVEAEVQAAPTVQPETVRRAAEAALYAFVNPLTGGPDGTGWPFDLDLYVDDVRSVLRAVPGVVRVVEARLLAVDLHGRLPSEQQHRLSLPPDALFMSVAHRVVAHP